MEAPGAFPETPAETPAAVERQEESAFSVAPIPQSDGPSNPVALAAGEKVPEPSTLHSNTITSAVHDDPELKAQDDINTFSVSPIPASEGTGNPVHLEPGEKVPEPSTLHSNTITSAVHDDPELKAQDDVNTFGVSPIPATGGTGNPIHLQPGEEVPHHSTVTANTIDSNVKLDKESYEKSDSGAPQLPSALTPGSELEANGQKPVFSGLGPILGAPFIPESSLPMGEGAVSDVTPQVSSVAPQSTTAELAGQQPILPRGVPEVVSESQEEAHVSPEAAANPEAVQDKTEFENELKQTVSKEPATTESHVIPQVVEESQEKAHVEPEASANPEAVQEKTEMENELKQTISKEPATTESHVIPQVVEESQEKAHVDPEASANPVAVQDKTEMENELKKTISQEPAAAESHEVPQIVEESQEIAHADPEASANQEAVDDKARFENELKAKVPEEPATAESGLLGKSERGITGAIAGGAIAAGAAAAAGAYALREKATETIGEDPVATLPKAVQNVLPESVVGGATTSADTDAAGLPLEPATVPHVVEESQEKAHVEPEASANPEAVVEKAEFEDELKQKVPEAPATAESGLLGKSENNHNGVIGAVAGGAAAAGTAAAAGAYALRQKATETTGQDPVSKLPQSVQDSINSMNSKGTTAPITTSTGDAISKDPTLPQQTAIGEPVTVPAEIAAPGVPQEVVESQKEAHVSPEAAANPEAVVEKAAMEKELQSSLKPVEASGAPAPTVTAATTAVAPTTSASGAPQLAEPAAVSPISVENAEPSTGLIAGTAGGVGAATAAAVGATAITNKTNSGPTAPSHELNASADTPAKTVLQEERLAAPEQQEPLGSSDVSPVAATAITNTTNSGPTEASKELNASAATPAKTVLQEERLAAPEQQEPLDSRDVSPMSRVATKNHPEGSEAGPVVTDGVTSESVPAESKDAPVAATETATPAESKTVGSRPEVSNSTPNRRASFMDRLSKKSTNDNKTPEPAPAAAASGAESQKKRRSFFGRIKDKLSMK
jgi:hypothetical protein